MNGQIAYILKNFPKLSETFIASEIYRLENLGVDLKLFVLKTPGENLKHKMIEKINAKPFYLPETTSLTDSTLRGWLKLHFKDFSESFFSVAKKRPIGFLKAFYQAARQSIRARSSFFSLKKTYLKEAREDANNRYRIHPGSLWRNRVTGVIYSITREDTCITGP